MLKVGSIGIDCVKSWLNIGVSLTGGVLAKNVLRPTTVCGRSLTVASGLGNRVVSIQRCVAINRSILRRDEAIFLK